MRSTQTLVDKDLESLIGTGAIVSPFGLEGFVQPMSLDLPVHGPIYHVNQRFKPQNTPVLAGIREGSNCISEQDLDRGVVLERGQTYLTKLGSLILPENVRAVASPKSSIGRIDMQVRLLTDHCDSYDRVPYGGTGDGPRGSRSVGIWAEITPRSFRTRLTSGQALNQVRFFNDIEDAQAARAFPGLVRDAHGMSLRARLFEGAPDVITMHAGVPESGIVGYEARQTNHVVDLASRDHDPADFFTCHAGDGSRTFDLRHGAFYILATKDRIALPPQLNGEIDPYTHIFADLRSHYAGFADGGFGYRTDGNVIVLEVRSQEEGLYRIRDGDPILAMRLYGQTDSPKAGYGEVGNTYVEQKTPRLAKFFAA